MDTIHFRWIMECLQRVVDIGPKAICIWFDKQWRAIEAFNYGLTL